MFKPEIRIIAWDDCSFNVNTKKVRLVGAIYRGGSFMDGLLSANVTKDGMDATKKIASAVNKSRHYDQLSIIMLDGVTFAGFNVVDVKELGRKTKMPVIVIMRNRPDMKKFIDAMRKLPNFEKRKDIVRKAGKIHIYKNIFYQKYGMSTRGCEEILKITCVRSNIPEPIRVAHLIASGLSGESRGRA